MQTETKHTPGPWRYSRKDDRGWVSFCVAQQQGAPYTPHYSDVASLIAETVDGEQVNIQEANARLIAAAPELLEVLQTIENDSGQVPDWLWERIRAAIAAATSE